MTMQNYQYDDEQMIVDHGELGKIASARFEAQSFLQLHPEFFATRENGQKVTAYIEQNGLPLNAESMETAYRKLKASGEILPPRETIALMSADELKKFAAEHGEPVIDSWGRTNYELPQAYREPTSSDYNRPRQGTSLAPIEDPYPEDKNRTFTKKQLASFSADRYRAYLERTGQWGR